MSKISRIPVYNLSAVVKETGLHADVLRAWERRYQLPRPQRTSGGHRIYSEYDVATIKWLRARQGEGLSIRSAVELWREILDDGRDPLFEAGQGNGDRLAAYETNRLGLLRASWLKACLAYDAIRAEEAVSQALALASIETVCAEILQAGLRALGKLWQQDRASVQQEHFATALAMRRVEALISTTPNPTRPQKLLIGCPAGEWHSFPALLLTLLFRRRGLQVAFLGANVPLHQMKESAESIRPALILLTAQHLLAAAALQEVAVLFSPSEIPVAYGGGIFNRVPRLRSRIPAFFLGEGLADSIEKTEQLLALPPHRRPAPELQNDFRDTVELFQRNRPRIEVRLTDRFQGEDWPGGRLATVNAFLGEALAAALALGDPAFVENDLEWARRLLADRGAPADSIGPYLSAYREAVELEMGAAGEKITAWLGPYLAGE